MALKFTSFIFMTLFAFSYAQDYYNNAYQGSAPSPVYKSTKVHKIEKYGPYGSILPENYEFQIGEGERLSEVYVKDDYMVDAIGFLVAKPDKSTYTKQFGGNGGTLNTIVLEENEYLTKISGKYGYDTARKYIAIGSLTIHTNLRPQGYGPYGKAKDIDIRFDFQSPDNSGGPIVGFFGREGELIESIGIFVKKEEVQFFTRNFGLVLQIFPWLKFATGRNLLRNPTNVRLMKLPERLQW